MRFAVEPSETLEDIPTPRVIKAPNPMALEVIRGTDFFVDVELIREFYAKASPSSELILAHELIDTTNLVFDSTISSPAGFVEATFAITDHDEPGRKWLHLQLSRTDTARMIPGVYEYAVVGRLAAPDEESPLGVEVFVPLWGTLSILPVPGDLTTQ